MEKELDQEIIKATQNYLGKYVKRPALTEKLLKKPPFRFLHDIVTSVLKSTGFFEGLFDEAELISENVKDRESKISFLNKVVTVVSLTTGKSIQAKPSKIVAGQEADKTNELLQCLAFALDKKLSSQDAVRKYKANILTIDKPDKQTKNSIKTVKKASDDKKLKSNSTSKLVQEKKETNDKSTTNKQEKIKTNTTKITVLDKKEITKVKKELPSKQPKQSKVEPKSKINVKPLKKESIALTSDSQSDVTDENTHRAPTPVIKQNVDQSVNYSVLKDKQKEEIPNNMIETENNEMNSSYVINDNGFNSSLSSQDLMEPLDRLDANDSYETKQSMITKEETDKQITTNDNQPKINNNSEIFNKTEALDQISGVGSDNHLKELKNNSLDESSIEKQLHSAKEKLAATVRPSSVRPSSSRPGAPRLREKHDFHTAGDENLIVGKVKIIQENTSIEEEEDSSIIIVDPKINESQQDLIPLSSNQHGHLVQQILDSTKVYSQNTGNTEIEWQFDALKAREASSQEIEQVRFNIQALSRVANPLGKLLDHIQEDVEVMRQELLQWTKSYDDASKELLKQKTANEESLLPLHIKIKQLDLDIEEKRDKINDLRIIINKNASRINKLLASSNVQ